MMQAGRETDFERSKRFMLIQYRKIFEQMYLDFGDWACVGLNIGEDLERLKKK